MIKPQDIKTFLSFFQLKDYKATYFKLINHLHEEREIPIKAIGDKMGYDTNAGHQLRKYRNGDSKIPRIEKLYDLAAAFPTETCIFMGIRQEVLLDFARAQELRELKDRMARLEQELAALKKT